MNCDCGWRRVGRIRVWSIVMLGSLVGTPAVLCAAIPQTGCYKREGLEPKVEAAIEEFRASVPGIMDKGGVPGAAIALVDDKGIVWTEGFGYCGGKGKQPVTPDTPFMICGLSKLITATAVMLAVQDGSVKLDEPITTYLPDFKVNSRYEEHPEQKITLRRLLNCTAGIPAETPLGNGFEPASATSFEDHVRSLYGSWLVCPVGSSFFFSNVSYDLAAYTVRVVTGKLFKDYLRERLFTPLGMSHTTVDRQEILDNSERAIGRMMGMSKVPAVYPALGAAGIYSTARDMARFVQLHINQGTLDGRTMVDRSLMETIHAPVGIVSTKPTVYYGQGIRIDKRAPENTDPTRNGAAGTVLWHDGLGFGFLSLLHWYPEYGVGTVVLTNRLPHSALSDLGLTLTDKLIKGKIIAKRLPRPEPDGAAGKGPQTRRTALENPIGTWWGSQHQPTPYKPEWRQYCGTHNLRFNEYKLEWWAHLAVIIWARDEYTPRITVQEKDGFLCVTESKFFQMVNGLRSVDEKLQEVKPGVFATRGGGTLDFSGAVPTWCNYRLEK
jgi:CubicO group peptidase (beta-lactamase class C family)